MTKVEAIIQPNVFDTVKEALIGTRHRGNDGFTEVRGHGRQKGHTETYRGREYGMDFPQSEARACAARQFVAAAVDTIIKNASTGKIGDGKIFLYKVEEAIRIRSQERGAAAL